MEQKEILEFAIRFAGAMTGGLEDAAFESYLKMHPELAGKFPYVDYLNGKTPAADDLIVGGLAIPPWVIGMLMEEDAKKKGDTKAREMGRNVKMFGEGDVCYAGPMLIHHTLMRNIPNMWVPAARAGGTRSTSAGSTRRTDVGHRIVKL